MGVDDDRGADRAPAAPVRQLRPDPIFPMDGNRRIIERLRRFYEMLGSRTREIAEHISHGDHGDRSELRVATYRWINKHLKHDASPVADAI